jgi:ferritin-like metal-binding protein YciE
METAKDLFEHELRDMYDAEEKLVRATETMSKKVSDEQLTQAFAQHCEVTKNQVKRLEQVFKSIDREPRREKCPGINGLIEEFSEFVKEGPGAEALNFFAIGAASKVEHYEIEAYKSLIALADQIGVDPAPLVQNLAEEEETATMLESLSRDFAKRLPKNGG